MPHVQPWIGGATASKEEESEAGHDDHDEHEHEGHEEANSLELSPQARKSIGLTTGRVALEEYERTIAIPAVVAERPGRTRIQVAAPLTGTVTAVLIAKGQAVEPGDLLFHLRLTHEDLVLAQTEFLKTVEALDVETREIARLEKLTEGVVARKTVLERQYEKQKLEGLLRAQREALLLHGLTEAQVQQIIQDRRLLRELAVYAPEVADHEEEQRFLNRNARDVSRAGFVQNEAATEGSHPLVVQNLNVHQGDIVEAGAPLCDVADLNVLYVEGLGFEQDAKEVTEAANRNWPVTAIFEDQVSQPETITGLSIVYVANQVEAESRAFQFYAALPNQIVRDAPGNDGEQRFVAWKYKPGQRLTLLIPVEQWRERIVLPVQAVATEGVENYVFVQNGHHFDRRPVHVEYRDQRQAVLANDGSIFVGETVALNSAHQLQLALKNKAGGGPDPHAGHNH